MMILSWTDDAGARVYLALDAGETEGYRNTAASSDNPVETGANISDNVRPDPATLTVSGWITNYPVTLPITQVDGITQSAAPLALASGNVTVQKFSAPFNRVNACDELLLGLWEAGTPLTVTTRLRSLSPAVITSYGVDRKAENGEALAVTLAFKVLRLVTTQTVAVPAPAQRRGQTATNRGPQPAAPPATPAQTQSLGARLLDATGVHL